MIKLPTPRFYQDKGLNLTRRAFKDNMRKILFWLATGGGKSVIFLIFIVNLLKNNKKVCLVMRRRQLVFQAYERFKKFGIDCSMIMGNDKRFDPSKNLQICSIDTVSRRDITFMKDFDVTVIDEAHDCTSKKYQEFLEEMNSWLYLGLTASPFQVGKKVHSFWDCCVKPIEVHELRDLGFLTDAKILIPHKINLEGIKTYQGDYQNKQLFEKMSEMEVIGDVVQDYIDYGENKTAICFGVNKEHSIMLRDSFLLAGIEAIHCDESTKQKDRDGAILRLRECAKIKKPFVLCNVNIFSTGVDIPEAEVGIMARPTKSEILYIQQIGRLLRPYRRCGRCKQAYDNSDNCPHCGYDKPEHIKKHAIIIDSGNNTLRHGSPFKVRTAVLTEEDKKTKKENEEEEFKTKICKGCFATYEANLKECPFCDYKNEKVQREIKRADGKIVPYDEFKVMQERLWDLEMLRDSRGFKQNFHFFKLYDEYGSQVYNYPDLGVPKWVGKIVEKNKAQENIYS